MDTEELKKSLPITVGKVNAVVSKREEWSESDLNERTVQFGPVAFTYRDIISFSEVQHKPPCTPQAQHCTGMHTLQCGMLWMKDAQLHLALHCRYSPLLMRMDLVRSVRVK